MTKEFYPQMSADGRRWKTGEFYRFNWSQFRPKSELIAPNRTQSDWMGPDPTEKTLKSARLMGLMSPRGNEHEKAVTPAEARRAQRRPQLGRPSPGFSTIESESRIQIGIRASSYFSAVSAALRENLSVRKLEGRDGMKMAGLMQNRQSIRQRRTQTQ